MAETGGGPGATAGAGGGPGPTAGAGGGPGPTAGAGGGPGPTAGAGGGPAARTVLQRCLQATLQVKPADELSEAQFVQIDRGMVIYVCFFKGATEDILPKMVSTLLNLRLCESDSGKMVSVLELPGSLLIVPQATLGGKAKGRGMQYHNNISKEDGLRLYSAFVALCEKELTAAAAAAGSQVTMKHGTYGNRQVLKLDTNGPYTHLMEF